MVTLKMKPINRSLRETKWCKYNTYMSVLSPASSFKSLYYLWSLFMFSKHSWLFGVKSLFDFHVNSNE